VRKPVPPEVIKGIKEAGWEPPGPPKYRLVHPGCGDGTPTTENLHRFMVALVNLVQNHIDSWPFISPVPAEEVPDYYEVVKDPICLETIKERVESGEYYQTLEMFAADFRLMFNNCRLYNAPDTVFYKNATRLEAYFESKVAAGISWNAGRGNRVALDRF
jgi:histone acetyltransferase